MKNITVFLASSDELKNDRNSSFHSLVASLDEIFEPRGYRIRCRRWEDFSAFCTGSRTQDDYNRIVRASDICICMFHRKAGEYTIEEFNQALDEYVKSQSHPKTFVYIRALIEGEMEDEALKRFKEDLFDRVGHYWCNYATDDAMKLHFVMQLERIIPSVSGNASVTEGNHFKIENGVVSLYGHKIAELDNLSFAAENPEYLSLKESIARLNTEIARLRATGVAELQPMIDEKQAELYKKRESLNRLESRLFDLALSINKLIGSGTPVSERKRLAIEMFERGNSKGVVEILNEKDIAADAAHARNMIEQGKLLVESIVAVDDGSAQDSVLRAKALMTDYAEPRRFELACHAYEQGIELTRANLSEEELAKSLFEYGHFLQTNKRYDLAEVRYRENLDICQRLAAISPYAYEPDLAGTQNNLGVLYNNTQRYKESEKMYLSALKICQRLTAANPQVYEPDLAMTQNNLGLLYSDIRRYEESEEMHLSAVEIYQRLTIVNPQVYEPDLAMAQSNLGTLYKDTRRYEDSEKLCLSAMEIRRRLAAANPQVYEPDLAMTQYNLGCLYSDTQRYEDSEKMYLSAMEIRRRLAVANPQVYEPDLADTQYNLGCLYYNIQRYEDSEEMYLSALEVYQRLTAVNPQVYEPYLVRACNNLSFLFLAQGNFEEAERYAREGSKYDFTHHAIYTNLAASLLLQGRYAEAEEIYLRYKEELKEDFLSDFEDFYRRGIIPPEREDDVERIKKLLSK